MDRSTILYIKC